MGGRTDAYIDWISRGYLGGIIVCGVMEEESLFVVSWSWHRYVSKCIFLLTVPRGGSHPQPPPTHAHAQWLEAATNTHTHTHTHTRSGW